jgi:hypothetical protein
MGGPVVDPAAFNEDRWRRVGASDKQVRKLADEFSQLDRDARLAENQRLASKSDDELATELKPSGKPEPGPVAQPVEEGTKTPDDVAD